MSICDRWRHLGETRVERIVLMTTGVLLVIISPIVGAIPGPGGVVVFAAGFAMMLKASLWVKKRYVRFKRAHPKKGEWVDFGLRRASYRRRRERLRQQQCDAGGVAE